jgi:hypothetical protein
MEIVNAMGIHRRVRLLFFKTMAVVGSLSSPTAGYATAYQFAAIAASFGLCAAGWLFDDANANRRRRRRGDCHDLSFVDRRAGAENSQFAGYAYFHPPTQISQQHDFAAFAATMKIHSRFGQKFLPSPACPLSR